MTDIQFKPYIYLIDTAGRFFLCTYGVEARYEKKNKPRFVFTREFSSSSKFKNRLDAFWHGAKACIYTFDEAYSEDYDINNEKNAWIAAEHIADTLNRWIPHHTEEELNTLVRLLCRISNAAPGEAAKETLSQLEEGIKEAGESDLVAEYRSLEKQGD